MIRYLNVDEKIKCRTLWEEAFPEDSASFDDYYFTEKLKENRILVLEEGGEIASMLHQNPYQIHVRELVWNCDYLVGVATRIKSRKRGMMRQLLHHMMQEMWQEQMPFCFLMPASEAIYRPFGFTYIFDQPHDMLRSGQKLHRQNLLPWKDSVGAKAYLSQLGEWMDRWLAKQYEVYTVRNETYLRRLLSELSSEDGTFEVLYDKNQLIGFQSSWGLGKPEQRLLLCDGIYRKEEKVPTPAIMARIICLEQFVRPICLLPHVKEEELCIRLIVEDPLLPPNDGSWVWHLNHETSWLTRDQDSEGQAVPVLRLAVEELTGWLFGYQMPEAAVFYRDKIRVLQGVFLDEIV